MKNVVLQWVRGILASLLTMIIYTVPVGCYLALMLLIISMEEGGENLTVHAMSLTQAAVLLTQGSGFAVDWLQLTIMPLLLTMLMIWLLAHMLIRCKAVGVHGYCAGLIVWLVCTMMMRRDLGVALVDDAWVTLVKAAAVFALSGILAGLISTDVPPRVSAWLRQQLTAPTRRCLRLGMSVAITLLASYAIIGLITVLVWIVRNHQAMMQIFDMTGMGIGSRILTTIACLIWLPNLVIWAVSWTFGGGFAIGELATFTLWTGQSQELPPVPMFGLFPESVSTAGIRLLLIALPLLIAFGVALAAIFLPKGFRYRFSTQTSLAALFNLLYPAVTFCLSTMLVTLVSALMFVLSNGSLGHQRLANVGVDVMASTRAIGHPTALGLAMAWVATLIGSALVFGIGWAVERIRVRRAGTRSDSTSSVASSPGDAESKPSKEDSDD